MIYRQLGKTGLKVSQLGFGCMRLPMKGDAVDRELAIPMIHRALDAGVNYVDTAVGYLNGDSQRAVGEALKGRRDKVVLSTKNHYFGEVEKDWWSNLETSLKLLQTDHIDIYNTHGIAWKTYEDAVAPRVSKWITKAKAQGMIRHICTSFHDDNDALRRVIDTGFYESVTLQYNLLDKKLEDGISYAKQKGMGVVVMGPVGGGRLGVTTEVLKKILPAGVSRMPELALKFVLSNPDITVALSGMSTMEQVEENLRVGSDAVSMTTEEKKAIDDQLANLNKASDLYCSGCAYCQPCPSGVDIPMIFKVYNESRAYGMWDHGKGAYKWYQENMKVTVEYCTECGNCLEKCPQKIDIPKRLKEAHKALT